MANSKWWPLENLFNLIFNDSRNTVNVDSTIQGSNIAMPMDFQTVYRQDGLVNLKNSSFGGGSGVAAGASYTSPALDVSNARNVVGIIYSDTTWSYRMEHSYDGAAWYWGQNNSSLAAGSNKIITEPVTAKYIRLVYTNNGTGNTTGLFINFNIFPN